MPTVDQNADSSSVRELRPGVFRVAARREHVALMFGGRAEELDGERADSLSRQIVLSPFVAKRVSAALAEVVRAYESRYGPLPAADRAEPPETPTAAAPAGPDERARLLLRVVRDLGGQAGIERSVKVAGGKLYAGRFLLGMSKRELGARAAERLSGACDRLGMPAALMAAVAAHLPSADYVHFGFEAGAGGAVYKVYLEFAAAILQRLGAGAQRPAAAVLHLGLKWDTDRPARQAVTRYVWHPWIGAPELVTRVAAIVSGCPDAGLLPAAEQLVALATARVPARDILYLEATKDGNPRRSFDINVYRAGLDVAEVYPLLSTLCRCQAAPYDRFHSLYGRIRSARFGHLAGGVGRQGQAFFTFYFGAEGLTGALGAQTAGTGGVSPAPARLRPAGPRRGRLEETDEQAADLLRRLEALGQRIGLEHSAKFVAGQLLPDRLLAGVRRPPDGALDEGIRAICRRIGMPAEFAVAFTAQLPEAQIVLFGIERGQAGRVVKAYLEFGDRVAATAAQVPRPEGVVTHTGFKWHAGEGGGRSVARYTAYPFLTIEQVAGRILGGFYRDPADEVYRLVDDLLDLAGTRLLPGQLRYLEACESTNVRRSFDINAYFAKLTVAEIFPLLVRAGRCFGVDQARVDAFYAPIREEYAGHLSGGVDREGRPFLTLYHSPDASSGDACP